MNKKTLGKRVLSFIMVMAMCFTNMTLYGIDANAKETVKVQVMNQPKVDILLTTGQTNTNLTTFENDIKASLQKKGIDTSNITFQTLDAGETKTEATDAAVIFNTWQKFGKGGQWSLNTYNGVTTILNTENTEGLTGFYSKDTQNLTDMTMEFDFMPYDNDDDYIGVILRFSMNNDLSNTSKPLATQVSGYWYWENGGDTQGSGGWTWSDATGLYKANGAILPGNYQSDAPTYGGLPTIDSNAWSTQPNIKRLVLHASNQKWTSRGWTHYKFQMEGNTFRGWRDGVQIINYTDNSANPITTGTFALINQSQASRYKNFVCSYKYFKEYTEVLSQPKWRDDATHVIVNVNDTIDNSLNDGAVIAETNSKNIHFIQWGTNTNKSFVESFINNNNDKKGMFTQNSNYNQAVEDTTTYIANLFAKDVESQYVIVGQDTNIVVTPSSYKTGATSASLPNGRWYINHDYTYYANNLGQSTQAGFYTPNLTCNFDKPGKYDIYFDGQDADHLVKTVYAHRLPTADFSIGINGTTLTLTSQSEDLDSNTNNGYGKGIKAEHWYYKKTTDSSWTSGKLTTFDRNSIYLIKLEVEDFQGATAYTTKYVGTGNPVANFNLSSYNFSKYQTVNVNDTSYDPEGYAITKWTWTLKKGSTTIATSTAQKPSFDFRTYGTGDYKLSLVVTNSKGTTSSEYTRSFTVIDDTDAPEIIINPQNCDWKTGTQAISVSVSDADSGFKDWSYAFTTSQTYPTSGFSVAQTSANGSVTTPSTTGEYYLHIKAHDIAGNELRRTVGTYKIDNTIPTISKLTIANDCTKVVVDASDVGSGIAGYAITTTNTAPNASNYQASNELKIYKSGTYYVWVKDKVGQVSASKSVLVNRKQTAIINYVDNNDSEKLRPSKVTLSIYRNGTFLKNVELDGTTTSYTFENLDSMDASGKAYTYTFGLDVNERYAIKVDGDTITATMKQTTFSVIIPKTISIDGSTGKTTYKVETSGTLFLNDSVSVVPDTSFNMQDEMKFQTMKVNVSQPATSFKKTNLGTSTGTLTTTRKEFAGTWSGNFNFAIKLTKAN